MLQEYRTKESAQILYPALFRSELSEIHELYGPKTSTVAAGLDQKYCESSLNYGHFGIFENESLFLCFQDDSASQSVVVSRMEKYNMLKINKIMKKN
jgi:hypothetical protein